MVGSLQVSGALTPRYPVQWIRSSRHAKRSRLQPAAFRRLRSGGPLGSGVSAEVADAPPGASASCTHAAMRQPRRARAKNPHSWPEQRERAKACRFDCRKICTRQRHRSGFSAVKRVLSRESAQHYQPRLPSASADIKQASRSPEGLSQAREESSYGALAGLQKSHGKAVRMLTRF